MLVAGSELGAETTQQYTLQFGGQLVQIDANEERIGATFPALGLVGDARATLAALHERLPKREPDGRAEERARAVRQRIVSGLDEQGRELERGLLESVRGALPRDAAAGWDMTILAYWAGAHFPVLGPAPVPLPARLGHARLLVARGTRSGGRARAAARLPSPETGVSSTASRSSRQRGSTACRRPFCSSTTAATGSCGSTSATPTARPSRSTWSSPTSPSSRAPSASPSSRPPRMRSGTRWPGPCLGRARGGPPPCPPRDVGPRPPDDDRLDQPRAPVARRARALPPGPQPVRASARARPRRDREAELERGSVRSASGSTRRGQGRARQCLDVPGAGLQRSARGRRGLAELPPRDDRPRPRDPGADRAVAHTSSGPETRS